MAQYQIEINSIANGNQTGALPFLAVVFPRHPGLLQQKAQSPETGLLVKCWATVRYLDGFGPGQSHVQKEALEAT